MNKTLVLLTIIFAFNSLFAQHPNMFLNVSEINSIKAKIDAREEPWNTAFNTAVSRADLLLDLSPVSVRDGGSNTNGIYDGNFSDNRRDYNAARTMSYAIRDLGIAYQFNAKDAYAIKAIELINHWTINSNSRMNPQFSSNQSWIELAITLPAMLYGADMIWNYSGWSASEKAEFIKWVQDFIDLTILSQTNVPTNNFGDWRLVFLAAAGVIVEDPTVMSYVVNHYKSLVPTQIDRSGRFGWEQNRATPKNGLFYSTYALTAIAQICEIVRHHGTDLYIWKASNGAGSVEKGFDHLASYATNPSTWTTTPWGQSTNGYTYMGENAASFELAYSIWQKPEYLQVIQTWNRPMYGNYVQGPLTLTHAFRGITVSVPELDIEKITTVYPNPTSNYFTIDLKGKTLEKAIIYNQLGRKVKEVNTSIVDISGLSNGIYFVKITSKGGKMTTIKILKN